MFATVLSKKIEGLVMRIFGDVTIKNGTSNNNQKMDGLGKENCVTPMRMFQH